MTVKIRLSRCGKKNNPEFRIVSADSRCPRDGRFIQKIGNYNPVLNDDNPRRLMMNIEKLKYWLSVGAQPTDRVRKLIARYKLLA